MSKTITITSIKKRPQERPAAPLQQAAAPADVLPLQGDAPPNPCAAVEAAFDFWAPRLEQALAIVRLVGTIFDTPEDDRPHANYTFSSLEFAARLLNECEEQYTESDLAGDDCITTNYQAIGLLSVLTELVWDDSCEFRQPDALYESYLHAVEGAIERARVELSTALSQARRESGLAA